MNSEPKATSMDQEAGTSPSVVLIVQGLGPVPPLKNSKAIFRNHETGKPFIATKPETKAWMQRAIQSLRSQLNYLSRTTSAAMPTGASRLCLTALLQHSADFDDSIQWIPEESIRVIPCDKGNDGCKIKITLLPP